MNISETLQLQIKSRQKRFLAIGIIGAVLCVVGAFTNSTMFFRGYLLGYMFWMNLTLGCLGLVMLHHLVGGDWGHASRRFLEAGMRTLPLMLVLFIPLLVAMPTLYEWARPEHVAHDPILTQKANYLNPTWFSIRTGIYFLFWFVWMRMLYKGSQDFERTPNLSIVQRLENISGPGVVLFFLATTFASFDWVMSLEPHWYSTIYGALFVVGQGLATLAFAIIMTTWFSRHEPFSELTTQKQLHDLGKLTHGFVVLWAYAAFSQFLIIWSANLPEEIPWYLHRIRGGWEAIGLFLMIFHFFVPFFLLLSRQRKRQKERIFRVALFILLVRFVDLVWMIIPAFPNQGFPLHVMYFIPTIAIGGIWLGMFFWLLQGRSLLPLPDNSYDAVTGELEHA
ncbi:MAG: hypothetical protein AB7G75_01545 [Candidatus Binatia bacterium]